jgi:CBS domain-containing protein
MVHDRIAITAETTIEEAVKTMEDKRLLNLPVKQNGRIAYSVTRHDLLRAWIGIGTSGEE